MSLFDSRRAVARLCGAGLVLAATLPATAYASLGGEVRSVEHDRVAFSGSTTVSSASGYEVHEITTPSARIREYVASGRVFAVSWYGHAVPDLGQLLGEHAPAFHALVKPQPGNHHAVEKRDENLIVSLRKLPRNMSGTVIVRALVPAGLDLNTLR